MNSLLLHYQPMIKELWAIRRIRVLSYEAKTTIFSLKPHEVSPRAAGTIRRGLEDNAEASTARSNYNLALAYTSSPASVVEFLREASSHETSVPERAMWAHLAPPSVCSSCSWLSHVVFEKGTEAGQCTTMPWRNCHHCHLCCYTASH